MTASIIIHFDQVLSKGVAFLEYQKQLATECWPFVVVVVIGGGIAVWGGIKIWSRALSVKARELAKPIIDQ